MSHILDALRQAEQERHLGEPVTRSTIAGPLRQPRRRRRQRRLTLPLVIAALVAAVAAGWWAMQARAPSLETAAPAPASLAVSVPPPVPVVAATLAEPAADGPRRARVQDAARLDRFDALLPAAPDRPGPSASTERQRLEIAPFDLAGGGEPPVRQAPSSSAQDAARPTSSSATPTDRAIAAAIPTIDEAVPLPSPRVFGHSDIAIDVHVYNPDPAQRFILVGGRRYNAGDTLPDNVRLRAIEADAVVLEVDGQRMRQSMR